MSRGFTHAAIVSPARELLVLSIPTFAQMASYTLMQFVDTWMLSRVSASAATAGANAGMMAYAVLSFGMGIIWIVNTLVSQAYGRGEERSCGSHLWQGVWVGVGYGILLIPAIALANGMFYAFGHAPDEVTLEATYYRIAVAGAGIKLVDAAFAQFLLATDRPGPVFFAAFAGVGVNIVAAWILVFGHLGAQAMGVAGSAWAMNIGVTCELLVLVGFSLSQRARFGALDARLNLEKMRTLLRVGVPSGVQFIADILAWSLFANVVVGALGPAAMAANTFMLRYMVVSFMPAIGMGVAVTALVGRYIGRGEPDIAAARAHLGYAMIAVYQALCGIVFFLGRYSLLRVFSDDAQVLAIGATYMTYSAVYQLFDALYINYSGALRGAGDTFVPALVTGILNWSINVGLGLYVVRHAPSLGVGGPWLIATIYGAVLGFFIFARFQRGQWRAIDLNEGADSNVPVLSAI